MVIAALSLFLIARARAITRAEGMQMSEGNGDAEWRPWAGSNRQPLAS
jgi:hypothetical protein